MKNLTLLLFTFLSFSFVAIAQGEKVVLCDDYNKTDGTPSGVDNNWDIDKVKGSYVYVVYSQDYVIKDKLMLYVDKKNSNGSYIAFATEEFTYNPATDRKKWAMFDYLFTESGDYRISVMGKADDALAVTYTNIGYMKDKDGSGTSEKTSSKDGITDTYYYEGSKLTFGESIDDKAVMSGQSSDFRLKNGKRDLVCKLEHEKALKVKSVSVTVYYGDDYKEKVSSETYTVGDLSWDWVKVPISVSKAGKYVVDIYNENDTFINSGYFEIKR